MSTPTPLTPATLARLRAARRVLVLGSGGAGKSTLAARLAPRLGLPLIHLDQEFWQPGWVQTADAEWDAHVVELTARERWIIDGNYSRTLPLRLARADAAILLDLPHLLCMRRILWRIWANYGRVRPDMPPGCPEHFDPAFIHWVWTYPRRSRRKILRLLAEHEPTCHSLRLRSPREVAALLRELDDH